MGRLCPAADNRPLSAGEWTQELRGDTRHYPVRGQAVELATKAIRRFAKISESWRRPLLGPGGLVSIVPYSQPPLMIIALASQFHVYLLWSQCPLSKVS